MNGNDQARRAADLPEIMLHRKVKEIMTTDGIPYFDALEVAWYDPANATLVDSCRAVVGDDEDPDVVGPMLPVDAGIEVDKRVRAHLSAHETTRHMALQSVLFADRALAAAWDTDVVLGTN